MLGLIAYLIASAVASSPCQVLYLLAEGTPPAQVHILDQALRRARPACVIERHTLPSLAHLREQGGIFDVAVVHGFTSGEAIDPPSEGLLRPKLADDGLLIVVTKERPVPDVGLRLLRELGASKGRAFVVARPDALISRSALLARDWDTALTQSLLIAALFGLHSLVNSRELHPQLIMYPLAATAGLKAAHALIGDLRYGSVFNANSPAHNLLQITLGFASGELALVLMHGDLTSVGAGAGVGAVLAGLSHLWTARHLKRLRGQGRLLRPNATGEVDSIETDLTNALTCPKLLEAS